MTFRAKPVVKRTHRPQWETEGRQHLYTNIAFGLVVVAAVLILAAAAGASYYGDHLAAAAKVNGVTISKDQLRDLIAVESWRLDRDEQRIRDQVAKGRISDAAAQQQLQAISSQRSNSQQFVTKVFDDAIDDELRAQLAAKNGVTVTDPQIDARLTEEATIKEQRHAWLIAVKPVPSAGATEPTADQKAAAKAKAQAALADLKAGKAFKDVAKGASTDGSASDGGDLGWIGADDAHDKGFVDALFKAQANVPTDVIEGADGVFRVGEVTEIAPASVDPNYQQKIVDQGKVSLAAYRSAVKADLITEALQAKIIADATEQPTVQRHVLEIYLAKPVSPGDQVKTRHILYSPNHDPASASKLSPDDPAWQIAKAEAQNTYDRLKALEGTPDDLAKTFADIAKAESDDKGSGAQGGDLDYYSKTDLDQAFADAIFKDGLTPGQLLAPVKSQFGWHVIQFLGRRQDAQTRITALQAKAAGGADFGQLAKDNSESADKDKGGDMGWVSHYQLDADLEKAIFDVKVGSVSNVITVGDGLYVFKVLDEQTRKADGDQVTALKSDGYTNWYTAQKNAAEIFRDPAFLAPSSSTTG